MTNSSNVLSPAELVRVIQLLPEALPLTDAFEARTMADYPGSSVPWYRSQKEHLIGFIGDYNGPGAYNRTGFDGTARDWYQRFQCAPGLLWLAEALGEERDILQSGIDAIRAAGPHSASQCGAFRKVVPWVRIEELLRPHLRRHQR